MRVFSIDLLPRKLLGYIHDVLQRLRKKSVGGSVRDSCIKSMLFRVESKRAKQQGSRGSDVNAQPLKFSAVYHRKFLHGRVYTTRRGLVPTWPTMLPPPHSVCILSCPTSSLVRTIYMYIFALCHEFPTYSSKVFTTCWLV